MRQDKFNEAAMSPTAVNRHDAHNADPALAAMDAPASLR
ncbi:hypothetical protein ART_0465 [Arthrobacter sp. PAMC 25486]|nr:hypothetical protein ART_0465 [Arthrobacter sp. PAMC 25486]